MVGSAIWGIITTLQVQLFPKIALPTMLSPTCLLHIAIDLESVKCTKKSSRFDHSEFYLEYFLSTTHRLFKGGAFEFVKQSWILRVLVGHFKLWYDVSMATTRISANQSAITLFALVGVQKSVIALWLVRRSAITKIIALWRVIQSLWQCVIGMWL